MVVNALSNQMTDMNNMEMCVFFVFFGTPSELKLLYNDLLNLLKSINHSDMQWILNKLFKGMLSVVVKVCPLFHHCLDTFAIIMHCLLGSHPS